MCPQHGPTVNDRTGRTYTRSGIWASHVPRAEWVSGAPRHEPFHAHPLPPTASTALYGGSVGENRLMTVKYSLSTYVHTHAYTRMYLSSPASPCDTVSVFVLFEFLSHNRSLGFYHRAPCTLFRYFYSRIGVENKIFSLLWVSVLEVTAGDRALSSGSGRDFREQEVVHDLPTGSPSPQRSLPSLSLLTYFYLGLIDTRCVFNPDFTGVLWCRPLPLTPRTFRVVGLCL